jgi:hypothetical protein
LPKPFLLLLLLVLRQQLNILLLPVEVAVEQWAAVALVD